MLTVYQVFKIIFGLIVSIFILYFLIQYAANYSSSQETVQKSRMMETFLQDVENVYLSGNSINFSLSSKYNFSGCKPILNEPEMPSIVCDFGETGPIRSPLIFRFRDKEPVFLERKTIGYGFWNLYFVEALPETMILFTPIDTSDTAWNLMITITNNLPDTTDYFPKTTFGFCNGHTLDEFLCGGVRCEKPDFLSYLNLPHGGIHFIPCTAIISGRYTLVTISEACSPYYAKSGVCIRTPDSHGVGYAYLAGYNKEFIYKDPADLIALIIGGNRKDVFGVPYGESLYEYKNEGFGKRLRLVSDMMSQRAVLVANELVSGHECSDIYSDLSSALEDISKYAEDYTEFMKVSRLVDSIESTMVLQQSLVDLGCEYHV